ncbi:hypothetical protein CVT24_008062 [Panaeolus cyanescens]|uniref:Cytochrome P450 n=1 Tax=Panaeolus cyanescens TaxID=181874 RepID=A0A409W510_9AGAR|nr:hypothetical protein CVT24_008062 [Panaeolus cyanescens]
MDYLNLSGIFSTSVRVIGLFGVTISVYGVTKLVIAVYRELTSPLRLLRGPPSRSFALGNFREIWDTGNDSRHEEWVKRYGSTMKYKGLFGVTRLYTVDLKAINHVVMNNYDYQKPEAAVYSLKQVTGDSGVLLVEGDAHKLQRKILNPAFGPQQMREIASVVVEKTIQLRDAWLSELAEEQGPKRIDALSWLSRATLDVIGLTGFNYDFEALTPDGPDKNELNRAFKTLFETGGELNVPAVLRSLFPIFRFLPVPGDAEAKIAFRNMFRISAELLRDTRARLQAESFDSASKGWRSRDMLSLLVRANAMPGIPEDQRLSDNDVLSQIPTFIIAGHETTSVGTCWALYALSRNKRVQNKLRKELLAFPSHLPTNDELHGLQYLDHVVRESLRLYAPIPATLRVAQKDDMLPLSKPIIDNHGVVRHEIPIKKGHMIMIPISHVNRTEEIWGEDATEFKPERWEEPSPTSGPIPSVWGNTLSFLNGPRACIGYRYALLEMKALLFTLIRAFEFELAVPANEISRVSTIVQRPVLTSDPDKHNQMPLLIRPVNSST